MVRWMDHLAALNPDGLRRAGLYNSYGDWLNVEAPTDKALLATAYWAIDALTMAKAARALGRLDREVAAWEALLLVRAANLEDHAGAVGRKVSELLTGRIDS